MVRRAFALLALAVSAVSAWGEFWSVYQVEARTEKELARLIESDLNVMDCHPHLGKNQVAVTQDEIGELSALGLYFEYLRPLEDPMDWASRYLVPQADYKDSFLRYDVMIAQYEAWRAQYPRVLTRQQFGSSHQGRPLWAYRLSVGRKPVAQRKSIVVSALTHAREWGTGPIVMHILDRTLQEASRTRRGLPVLDDLNLYIVPCVNPDGYEYSWTNTRLWRKNRRQITSTNWGVDLNRNFPTGWGGSGSSGNSGSETYRGPSALSEAESAAYNGFMQTVPNLRGVIDYHTYSQLVLFPWGYTANQIPTSDYNRHRTLGLQIVGAIQGATGANFITGPISTTLYLASGGSIDHWYQTRQALSFTIEARDTGSYGFLMPESEILPNITENYAGFQQLLKTVAANP